MKPNYVVVLLLICSIFISTNAKAFSLNDKLTQVMGLQDKEVIATIEPTKVQNVVEEKEVVIEEEQMCANPNIVLAKVKKVPNKKGYAIFVGNKQAIWFVKDTAGMTSQRRAEIVAERLNNLLAQGVDASAIKPVRIGNNTFINAGQTNLVTVDSLNAKAVGVSVHELAYTWANGTRIALGASPLKKDYADVSRGFSGKTNRYIGQKTVGMASWYGPNFHGKRAADGSRFNANEYTAAHRTYPFGTLVKVTNLRNSKSCVVKITDRGPYAHGRIIDLSSKAAKDIGVSGVVKVKLEVIGQY